MMDQGAAVAMLLAGLLVLAAVAVPLVMVGRMPAAQRRAWLSVLRSRRMLRRARRRHEVLIRGAERALRRVERDHSSAVAALDRRIVELEDPRGRRLDGYGPVTLHELRIVTPAGEVALDGVEATVDTAGTLSETKRTTFTRLAVGGFVLGPLGAILALGFPKRRTVDTRELYLLIEAGTASCVLQVRPDDGGRVRAFVVQLHAAAAAVAARRRAIAVELEDARRRLSEVREDHAVLDAARARLAAVRADRAALAAIAEAEVAAAAAQGALADLRG